MIKLFTPEYIENVRSKLPAQAMLLESGSRQPVHTLYGGAQMFNESTFNRIRETAIKQFTTYCPQPETLAQIFPQTAALGFPTALLYEAVLQKLKNECVEDYRIDFEDGYGYRPDEEEDTHAIHAAETAAVLLQQKAAPRHFGFRIKPFAPSSINRSLRTLEIFLSRLCLNLDASQLKGFLVTLPKVETVEQVKQFNTALDMLCQAFHLDNTHIKTELMIETPSAITNDAGQINVPLLVKAAGERLFAIHAGLYDFTGALDIAATDQMYHHPYCDLLRFFLLAAGKSAMVHVSDGATSFLPVEKFKQPANIEQFNENKRIIWKAWRLHFDNILHSLSLGIVQGWDLHPAQIPVRYAAMYYYFRKDKDKLMNRFKNFIKAAAQATSKNGTFDDAATGQGMLNFLLKGYECGAFTHEDFDEYGLEHSILLTRSFPKICEAFTQK